MLSEAAGMFAHDHAVLADDDALGIDMDVDRPATRLGIDRVFVAIEAYQTELGDSRHRRPEAVEGAAVWDQGGTLSFEHLEDSLLLLLGMRSRLGVGHAAVEQVGIELGVALVLQPRREEA